MFYYKRPEDPDAAGAPTPATPHFRNIHFRNITIANPRGRAIYITGLAERPLKDITFTDVTAESAAGMYVRNIDGLALQRVVVKPARGPAFEWGVKVTNRHGP